MVDSSRRRGKNRSVMANHNRCWIWGRNVVLETLRAAKWPILELRLSPRAADPLLSDTLDLAQRMGVDSAVIDDDELSRICRAEDHQGFAAKMSPFPCLSVDDLLLRLPESPVIVLLDRLQDPFNLGAIIRSISTLNIDAVILGDQEQAEINSQVARSSAGAVNHVPIARSNDLVMTLDHLRSSGYRVVAASEKAERMVFEADFRSASVIIIGNEGRGIHRELLDRCDVAVCIPMSGTVGSLNAAVAAGILFYEVRRQRYGSDQKCGR